jgi:hypothetical protein
MANLPKAVIMISELNSAQDQAEGDLLHSNIWKMMFLYCSVYKMYKLVTHVPASGPQTN